MSLRAHLALGVARAEGHNFNGNRKCRAEALADLRLVHNHNKLLRAHFHHFLAQEGAAAAFHQVQVVVHVVSTVDGHVQLGFFVEGYQRDAQLLGLLLGSHRRRHRNNVLELTRLQKHT